MKNRESSVRVLLSSVAVLRLRRDLAWWVGRLLNELLDPSESDHGVQNLCMV